MALGVTICEMYKLNNVILAWSVLRKAVNLKTLHF